MNSPTIEINVRIAGDGTSTTVSFDVNAIPIEGQRGYNEIPSKLSPVAIISATVSGPTAVSVTSSSLSRSVVTLNLSAPLETPDNGLYVASLALAL